MVKHLAGSANIPSDFASRNAPACKEERCQVCTFIKKLEDSVVRSVSVKDIIDNVCKLPFTSRSAWKDVQSECPDLRRTIAHLRQGTRPSKKLTTIKDVKRYLKVATIAKDGLLIVRRNDPLLPPADLIVIPRSVLDGLIMALHIRLDHPSRYQLQLVVKRHFYALDLTKTIDRVHETCHTCASLKTFPDSIIHQSSEDPPESIGVNFAADVLKRNRQLILMLRETVTSFSSAMIIEDEKRDTLRDALVRLIVGLHPLDGPNAVVRVDAAPGFVSLTDDDTLKRFRISLQVGRIKNINKNPVAEKGIAELETELLRHESGGGVVSELSLAFCVARLNSRLRHQGLSSRELWTQRDQYTNEQIPVSDRDLIVNQSSNREKKNHQYSEKSKCSKSSRCVLKLNIGDLVYLYSDKQKCKARDRYIVVSIDGDWCFIKKFIGNQLRATSYKVKLSDCYRVNSEIQPHSVTWNPIPTDDDTDEILVENFGLYPEPELGVPPLLSVPLSDYQDSGSPGDQLDNIQDNDIADISQEDRYMVEKQRPQRARKQPSYLEDYEVY